MLGLSHLRDRTELPDPQDGADLPDGGPIDGAAASPSSTAPAAPKPAIEICDAADGGDDPELPRFCPRCGAKGLEAHVDVDRQTACATGFDGFCPACRWAGQINPDELNAHALPPAVRVEAQVLLREMQAAMADPSEGRALLALVQELRPRLPPRFSAVVDGALALWRDAIGAETATSPKEGA